MKLKLFFTLLFMISTLSFSSSFASNDCPHSWQVDTSKYPNNPQLIQAKQRLGSDMVETVVTSRVLSFEGVDGVQPPMEDLLSVSGSLREFLAYLYGNSKIQTVLKVEVKGCGNPHEFVFASTYMERSYPIERSTIIDWASVNPKSFTDFKKQETFSQDYLAAISQSQEFIDRYLQRKVNPLPLKTLDIFGRFSRLASLAQMQSLTPGCLYFDKRLFPSSLAIKTGAKCTFAQSFLQFVNPDDPQDQRMKWVILDSFELDFRAKIQTITCVDGKLAKKVTAVNPKCPKGYKKK